MVETKHLIHDYIHSEAVVVPEKISDDDLQYWQAQGFVAAEIPEKIIIATASTRKLVMAYALLNHFDFPHLAEGQDISSTQPLDLQNFFQKNIHNGDGSYKEGEILLGVYHGVPVYGRSTDGETPGNDPIQESVNKTTFARNNYYLGENVIVIAGDAVNTSTIVDSSGIPINSSEYLGKPANLPDFPRNGDAEQVLHFLQTYFDTYYAESRKIDHIMAFALAQGWFSGIQTSSVTLETKVQQEKRALLSAIDLDPHAGAGGVIQRLYDWEKEFEGVPDAEKWRWIIYCTFAGMPIFSMLGAIRNLAKPDPYQRA